MNGSDTILNTNLVNKEYDDSEKGAYSDKTDIDESDKFNFCNARCHYNYSYSPEACL